MTDKTNHENDKPTDDDNGGAEVKKYSQADLDKIIEEKTSGLRTKVDELLGEKKTAAQKAKEAEQRAAAEAEKRAKDEGDHKALFESSEQKRAEIENKYNDLRNSIRTEKRNGEAMKLALKMATGTNAELLAEFIQRRLDVSDDGKVVVLSETGDPTVSTLDDLKAELAKSGRYDALLAGSQASGGGADPSQRGGANAGSDLSKMTKEQKKAYYRRKREG